MKNKIKGEALMLRAGGKTIALATSCTLTTTTVTIDGRTKDDASGPAEEFDRVDWNASSENLVGRNENVTAEMVYSDLLALQLAGTPVELSMELITNSTSAIPTTGWTPESAANAQERGFAPVKGNALIESLNLSAPGEGNATLSVNFKGVGPINIITQ